ncbi:hypothetical protein SERLA73DRAFT_150288 [Serpula lacrymans var. lacrymans S7.3]|uniref:Uncharacterized protein n=1 Tax=Serpula lacrymans var. lacrymans (strain S7.3) TaxID=936435 RepID=F8PLX3_SERL3|nr:hypothetical protein SERLA73DRAFT_150288 [Serpula lacrymans var. lacrymans S7.3]
MARERVIIFIPVYSESEVIGIWDVEAVIPPEETIDIGRPTRVVLRRVGKECGGNQIDDYVVVELWSGKGTIVEGLHNYMSVWEPVQEDQSRCEGFFQRFKEFLATVGKVPRGVFPSNVVGEPQEGLYILNFARFRPIPDSLDFVVGHCEAFWREEENEVFDRVGMEKAFVRDIVEVDNKAAIKKVSKYCMDETLEGCGGVDDRRVGGQAWYRSSWRNSEYLGGQRCGGPSEVYAEPEGTVHFPNEEHWCSVFGGGWTYNPVGQVFFHKNLEGLQFLL